MMVLGKPDCRIAGLRAFDICIFLGLRARRLYVMNIVGLLGRFIIVFFVAFGHFYLNECCFTFECFARV